MLRWQMTLNLRNIISFAVVPFAFVVVSQVLTLAFSRGYGSAVDTFISPLFGTALFVYFVICGAFIFTHLKTRQQRINEFMLPATNAEKFIARYLLLILVFPLAGIIGYVAGDVVQLIITFIVNSDLAHSAVKLPNAEFSVFGMMPEGNGLQGVEVVVSSVLLYLLYHASVLLIGSIFHKHPLLMVFVIWFLISTALAAVGFGVMLLSASLIEEGYTIVIYKSWGMAIGDVVMLVLVVLFYMLAYRRYTRLQVINNQWINK